MDDGHNTDHVEPMIHEDLLQAISDLNEALKPSLQPNSAPYEIKNAEEEDSVELSSNNSLQNNLTEPSKEGSLNLLKKDVENPQSSAGNESSKESFKESEEVLQHLVALQDSVLMTLNSKGNEETNSKVETKKGTVNKESSTKDSNSKEYLTNGIEVFGENSSGGDVIENISEDSVHSGVGTMNLNCKSSESDESNDGKDNFPKSVNNETNENSMDSDHIVSNTESLLKSNSLILEKNGDKSDGKIEILDLENENDGKTFETPKSDDKSINNDVDSSINNDVDSFDSEISEVKITDEKLSAVEHYSRPFQYVRNEVKEQFSLTKYGNFGAHKEQQILRAVEEKKSALVKELEKEILSNEEIKDSAKALEGGWILTPASHIIKVLFEYPPSKKIPEFLKENKATVEPSYNKEPNLGAVDNFLMDIGLNLAREWVHVDLVRGQKRKRKKDESEATERTLKGLQATLEMLRKKNQGFHHRNKRCRICTFQTESQLVLSTHLSVPHHGAHGTMRCTYCDFETRQPYVMKFHMEAEHSVVARLEPPPSFFQCPLCPFETNTKTQLTKHQFRCCKTFDPKINLSPDIDVKTNSASAPNVTIMNKQWPPNIAPNRPNTTTLLQYQQQQAALNKINQNPNIYRVSGGVMQGLPIASSNLNRPFNSRSFLPNLQGMQMRQPMLVNQQNPYLRSPYILNNQGTFYVNAPNNVMQSRAQLPSTSLYQMNSLSYPYPLNQSQGIYLSSVSNPMISNPQYASNVNVAGRRFPAPQPVAVAPNVTNSNVPTPVALVTNVANNSQKLVQQPGTSGMKFSNIQPSHKPGITVKNLLQGSKENPGANIPMAGNIQSNSNFVICEICDGYIKDLDSLRVHLLWIHKIKIGAKIIKGLPPLNCQKCQYRFFTYQGLERHLLGVHRLVTSSMQDSAKHARDMGRCNLCGKMFESNLLTHLKSFHNLDLKPAHLTYRCTVCSSSFTSYQTFENHVYSAHSSVAKNMLDESIPSSKPKITPPINRTKTISSPATTNRCYFCKATFATEMELGEHLNTVHHLVSGRPGQNNLRKTCSKCGLIFVQYTRLIKHWKKSHLQPLTIKLCRVDKCDKCQKLLRKTKSQEIASSDTRLENDSVIEIIEKPPKEIPIETLDDSPKASLMCEETPLNETSKEEINENKEELKEKIEENKAEEESTESKLEHKEEPKETSPNSEESPELVDLTE